MRKSKTQEHAEYLRSVGMDVDFIYPNKVMISFPVGKYDETFIAMALKRNPRITNLGINLQGHYRFEGHRSILTKIREEYNDL